ERGGFASRAAAAVSCARLGRIARFAPAFAGRGIVARYRRRTHRTHTARPVGRRCNRRGSHRSLCRIHAFPMKKILLFLLLTVFARASAPLVIQTDFGTKDGAVAAMRGVAVGVDPHLAIYDLSHENTPFDIWEAA